MEVEGGVVDIYRRDRVMVGGDDVHLLRRAAVLPVLVAVDHDEARSFEVIVSRPSRMAGWL